jgi:ankyrin repeat protein
VWGLASKTPAEEFSVSERSKRIFVFLSILFFLVVPFILLRDPMLEGAARRGDIASAKVLLTLGADINSATTEGGMSTLDWAIVYGQRDMVEFLLKKHVRFNTNNILSIVPRGHEQIADILKHYGAVETGQRDSQDAIHCTLPRDQHRYATFDH